MRGTILTSGSESRLLMVFAGWGMDCNPFMALRGRGFDVAVVYDYSSESVFYPEKIYSEIMVLAWSFGVIVADRYIAMNPQLPVTRRVAVNGTLYPVNDDLGIPGSIFSGTLNGLSEASLRKFNIRMCGGAEAYKRFAASAPTRDIDSLRAELMAIASLEAAHAGWDRAYISDADRIIPVASQRRAWAAEGVNVVNMSGPHLPEFQMIIDEEFVNKPLVARRFGAVAETYEEHASVQADMARRLSQLWHQASPRYVGDVLEVGTGAGGFTREYLKWAQCRKLMLWDLTSIDEKLPGEHRVCDGETELRHCPDDSFDAIVSAATVQWFSSQASFFKECSRVLRPGGLLVVSTFGPENFRELGPSGYPEEKSLRRWLEDGFEIVSFESELCEMAFESPLQLLRHLKLTGVNALRDDTEAVSRARKVINSGLCKLTYHPVLIVGRRRVKSMNI